MKILVVDDEQGFGTLLGRALKRLGHQACVVCHPTDALEAFEGGSYDAVITDIDMPGMHGVELARRMRQLAGDLPIAFCTGSAPEDALVKQAETIGRVLPKVWTVADVKDVVADLSDKRRFARGSQHTLDRLPPTNHGAAVPAVHDKENRRRAARKIKVTCRDWTQVAKLCDEQQSGKTAITLRGSHKLTTGERLFVALRLPDEMVLSIAAEVGRVRTDPVDGQQVFSILMVGFTPEVSARLRSMAQSAGVLLGSTYTRSRNPRGSAPESPPAEDGAVLGNLRLREQIDQLSKKLKN